MSYRLINANDLSDKYPEVNDMPCIYADLPNGMDGNHYILKNSEAALLDFIDFAIGASNSLDDYTIGLRNGMRYVKSLIDGRDPEYETCDKEDRNGDNTTDF